MAAKMTDDEKALWTAVCAADFVTQVSAYYRGRTAWPDEDLRAAMLDDARTTADWAVEAARACDPKPAKKRGGKGGE